jgi:hypothetical protein
MGLDAFKKDTSTSTSSSSTQSSSSNTRSRQELADVDVDLESEGPYFTGVIDRKRETSISYVGVSAFPPSSRHRYEDVVVTIDSQSEYKRLDRKSRELNGNELDTLFERNMPKAREFIERFSSDGEDKRVVTCPVCSSKLDMSETDYTKVFGEIVHSDHTARTVVAELKDI